MESFSRRAFLSGFFVGVAATAWAGKLDDKPKGKLEIRRAETKPANGLTEATVAGTRDKVYLHKQVELTNADIAKAVAGMDQALDPAIDIEFTKEGARKMAALSADHKNKPLAILVDGKVVSAPVIRAKLTNKAQITGKFTRSEIEALVQALNPK